MEAMSKKWSKVEWMSTWIDRIDAYQTSKWNTRANYSAMRSFADSRGEYQTKCWRNLGGFGVHRRHYFRFIELHTARSSRRASTTCFSHRFMVSNAFNEGQLSHAWQSTLNAFEWERHMYRKFQWVKIYENSIIYTRKKIPTILDGDRKTFFRFRVDF